MKTFTARDLSHNTAAIRKAVREDGAALIQFKKQDRSVEEEFVIRKHEKLLGSFEKFEEAFDRAFSADRHGYKIALNEVEAALCRTGRVIGDPIKSPIDSALGMKK